MERYYNIAGVTILVKGVDEQMFTQEYRLETFRTEEKKADYEYTFSVVDVLDNPEGVCIYQKPMRIVYRDGDRNIEYFGGYIRCETVGNQTHVQVLKEQLLDRITSKVVLKALGIEALVLKVDAFILHSAFICVNGKGILFTAPSGTGKSTQAELWKQFRDAEIINGDRAIVKVKDDAIEACGLPFSGSSEYCKDACLPLSAVVYLEQAENTTIERLNGIQAFRRIWEQITIPVWEEQATEQIADKLMHLLNRVPVYKLACTPDESAVVALETILDKSKTNRKEK